MSIRSVLAQLRVEFPDVTISTIRFLESAGLVRPQRTASGYRQFSPTDVERLRYILTAQRDHYLPLKVIKGHLDALDRDHGLWRTSGCTPAISAPSSGGEAGGWACSRRSSRR
jgi:DNA-binding transcriptional MerR regulator